MIESAIFVSDWRLAKTSSQALYNLVSSKACGASSEDLEILESQIEKLSANAAFQSFPTELQQILENLPVAFCL